MKSTVRVPQGTGVFEAAFQIGQGRVAFEPFSEGDNQKYAVYLDDQRIGEVWKERVEHWDKSGRIRVNVRKATVWKCCLTGEFPDRLEYASRFRAISNLVDDYTRRNERALQGHS
jgi:hypothetical protein